MISLGRCTGGWWLARLCIRPYLKGVFFMNPYYPNLLSPIKIGNVTLKNRICVAPMNLREVDHNG